MTKGGEGASEPVTLRDVAAAAGVSLATASKALNDQGRMTIETRKRVREVAALLGFRPNARRRACSAAAASRWGC